MTSPAALQSVFPQAELGTFMALSKLDKEKQLRELTSIVTGIRLFNKECGKGGAGIDDCEYMGRESKLLCVVKINASCLGICSGIFGRP